MKYNLASPKEAGEAMKYFMELLQNKKLAEIKKISPKRTLKQNAYLHLLIGAFGNHFGYTLDEAKMVYKEINHDVYLYQKKGRTFFRSSAELAQDEMAKTIDKFRETSKEHGFPLPAATDQEWLRQIENEIERSKHYL